MAPPLPFPLLTHTFSQQQSPCSRGSPWSSGTSWTPLGNGDHLPHPCSGPRRGPAPTLQEERLPRPSDGPERPCPSLVSCRPRGPSPATGKKWHIVTEIVQVQATWLCGLQGPGQKDTLALAQTHWGFQGGDRGTFGKCGTLLVWSPRGCTCHQPRGQSDGCGIKSQLNEVSSLLLGVWFPSLENEQYLRVIIKLK